MKQRTYITGLASLLVVFLGIVFKLNHWPVAGHMLVLGIFLLVFLFLPLALRSNYKAEGSPQKKILYFVTWVTCMVVFISMLFKIQHWPGAGWAILVSLPFPYVVYLPVYLISTKKDPNHSIYYTVAILFLLVFVSAFSALLSLNVSRDKIADSLLLAENSSRVGNAISFLPNPNDTSQVVRKIDHLLELAVEYKNLDLQYYGISLDEWNKNPQSLLDSDEWSKWPQVKRNGQLVQQEEEIQKKFLKGSDDLITILENSPEYMYLAGVVTEILGIQKLPSGLFTWKSDVLKVRTFPWFLIYLNQVETNLKLMRLTWILH